MVAHTTGPRLHPKTRLPVGCSHCSPFRGTYAMVTYSFPLGAKKVPLGACSLATCAETSPERQESKPAQSARTLIEMHNARTHREGRQYKNDSCETTCLALLGASIKRWTNLFNDLLQACSTITAHFSQSGCGKICSYLHGTHTLFTATTPSSKHTSLRQVQQHLEGRQHSASAPRHVRTARGRRSAQRASRGREGPRRRASRQAEGPWQSSGTAQTLCSASGAPGRAARRCGRCGTRGPAPRRPAAGTAESPS